MFIKYSNNYYKHFVNLLQILCAVWAIVSDSLLFVDKQSDNAYLVLIRTSEQLILPVLHLYVKNHEKIRVDFLCNITCRYVVYRLLQFRSELRKTSDAKRLLERTILNPGHLIRDRNVIDSLLLSYLHLYFLSKQFN